MDPFEARLQFIQILHSLNPSSVVLGKAISFALKNSELNEDLHSVILEELEKIDMNARMNVMYFIEALVSNVASAQLKVDIKERPYMAHIERDFQLILSKVVPKDNLVNLTGCVTILQEVEKCFGEDNSKLRDVYNKLSVSHTNEKVGEVEGGFALSWKYLIEKKRLSLHSRLKILSDKPVIVVEEKGLNDDLERLSHKQILQRMENDRERHKRHKETNWVINRPSGKIDRDEFDKVWNQFGKMDPDDFDDLQELYFTAGESYQQIQA